MRQCEVYINKVKAGILTETDDNRYVFLYDGAYLESPDSTPVSLTMPLRQDPYCSDSLFPFFFNMLSEGENRHVQAQLLHLDPEDDFGIMLATAQCDTIGAVTIKPI
ncbi:MAG: HipA N-terminal domain-containing protein [Prevotella sp.]|nr:HipA N-terminal domain-containing protein [Prevotella sp.]